MKKALHSYISFFLFATLCIAQPQTLNSSVATANVEVERSVMIISSYSMANSWSSGTLDGFTEYFRNKNKYVEVGLVELNSFLDDGSLTQSLINTTLDKIKAEKPDLILACDYPAVVFCKRYRNEHFRDTPVIFVGYPSGMDFSLSEFPKSTAVIQSIDILGNVNLGLQLMPKTKRIAIITDAREEGKLVEATAKKIFKDFTKADITYLNGAKFSTEEMLKEISDLPRDSFVIYFNWGSFKDKYYMSYNTVIHKIVKSSKGPVLTLIATGHPFVLGGMLAQGKDQGRAAAAVAESVLFNGDNIEKIAPIFVPNQDEFSWNILKYFDLDVKKLPKDSLIKNKPQNFFYVNRMFMVAAMLLTAMVVMALVFLRKRKVSAAKNAFIFSKLPLRISAFDKDGKVVFTRAEHFDFGDDTSVGEFRSISDFGDLLDEKISDILARVHASGKDETSLYRWRNSIRRGHFVKLPKSKFGVDAVMIVSTDVTELENTSKKLADTVKNLEEVLAKAHDNEAKLKDALAFNSTILNNIPCSIFVKNHTQNGTYILSNDVFLKMTKVTDTVTGKTDFDIFHDRKTAEAFREDDKVVAASGTVHSIYEDVLMPYGKLVKCRTIKTSFRAASGDIYLMGITFDITESWETQEKMRTYINQEEMINSLLKLVLTSNDENEIVNAVLKSVGEHLNADRCYVFKYDAAAKVINNTAEWCLEGIEPQIEFLQGVPDVEVAPWTKAFKRKKLVYTNDLSSDTSEEFEAARATLEPQGIKSLLVSGIWGDGKLWGFMGIDFVRQKHTMSESDMNMINAIGNILGLYVDRRITMDILEESEAQKALILDSLQIPVILYNAKGKVMSVNSVAAKIANKSVEQILSEPCHINFCDGILKGDACLFKRCMAAKAPIVSEFSFRNREYLTMTSPVKNKNGEITHVIESCTDVTEIKESKRQLEVAMESVRDAYKAKTLFLATISHELRTPLNAVIGYSELSQDENISTAERLENLRIINVAANALLTLINDVLDLSKLEAGQMEIITSPMSMNNLMEELVNIFKFRVIKHNITMTYIVPENMPILLLDSVRIKQVMMNIVGNAVKFTDNGGVHLDVSYNQYPNKMSGDLNISVSDTGMGIDPRYIKKIFEPFERQPTNIVRGKHAYEGTGLGLVISQRLVREMGGLISVNSELNKGSTFTISIPNVECFNELGSKITVAKNPLVNLSKLKGKVLILDDVEMNLKVLGAMLKKFDLEIISSLNAKDAFTKAKASKPDLILSDLWMPEINGEGFAKMIRHDEELRMIPIVAVTADTESDNTAGYFDAILLKPITLERVETILRQFLHGE